MCWKLTKSVVKWNEVKSSAVKGGKSGRTVKGIYGGKVKWSDGYVKIGVQYLWSNSIRKLGAVPSSPCVASPMCIAANCSWSFVYWVIILRLFLLPYVYCFTVCVAVLHTLVAGLLRKVLRPATSAQAFLGFPVSKSECWDGSQDSKLLLHSSHVALPN
jgi:hypothetical protein